MFVFATSYKLHKDTSLTDAAVLEQDAMSSRAVLSERRER